MQHQKTNMTVYNTKMEKPFLELKFNPSSNKTITK
jgi:hypothetical protein